MEKRETIKITIEMDKESVLKIGRYLDVSYGGTGKIGLYESRDYVAAHLTEIIEQHTALED